MALLLLQSFSQFIPALGGPSDAAISMRTPFFGGQADCLNPEALSASMVASGSTLPPACSATPHSCQWFLPLSW